jgi:hypothetical protein
VADCFDTHTAKSRFDFHPRQGAHVEEEEIKGVTQAVRPPAFLVGIVAAGALTLGWIAFLLWLMLKAWSLV